MSATFAITEARAQLGSLIRRTASDRERITITDHGQAAAVFINPRELAEMEERMREFEEMEERMLELEEQLALARYRMEKANGTFVGIPHEEVGRMLGLVTE